MIVKINGCDKKIIIDSNDGDYYDEKALKWCDIYGKVNYRKTSVPLVYGNKIKIIGPSFGIKIWDLPTTIILALYNFYRFKRVIADKREFFANYWRQYKRLPLSKYTKSKTVAKYIFFTGSIWKKEQKTNTLRAAFIEACANNHRIKFEGGFAPRNDGNNFGYDNLVVKKRYSLNAYLSKTKKSLLVFSTPAVLSCHGWKLGEYLALGKVIITTDHVNELPYELENNEHVIYINSPAELDDKINFVLTHDSMKNLLENNARQYFENYLAPKIVIQNLLR